MKAIIPHDVPQYVFNTRYYGEQHMQLGPCVCCSFPGAVASALLLVCASALA